MVKADLTCKKDKPRHPYNWTYEGVKGVGEWVTCPSCKGDVKIKEENVEDGAGT